MMKKTILSFALCLAFPAYSATCSSYERDKAAHFAEIQGREVVQKYQGGNNIRTSISSCDYNSYTNKYNVEIDVSWNGLISGDYYNSSGRMTMDSNGVRRDYNETYRNQNLKDYAFWRGIGALALAAGAAGAASSENQQRQRSLAAQSSGSNQGNIWVSNQCGRTVDLYIYFKNANTDKWESRGSWSFSSGETGFLNTSGGRLKTKNAELYYAISPSFSSLGLSHTGSFSHNGISYQDRKVFDKTGDTEIRLCVD